MIRKRADKDVAREVDVKVEPRESHEERRKEEPRGRRMAVEQKDARHGEGRSGVPRREGAVGQAGEEGIRERREVAGTSAVDPGLQKEVHRKEVQDERKGNLPADFSQARKKKGDEGENDPDGPEVSERGIAVHDRIEPGRAKRLDRSENRKFGGGEKGHGRKKSRNGSGSRGFSHPARKDLRTQGIGFHRKHGIRWIQIFTKRT